MATAALNRERLTDAQLRRRYLTWRHSSNRIADDFGCSSQFVRERLRSAGIPLRPPGSTVPFGDVDVDLLTGWCAAGLTLREIADQLGRTPSGVAKLLRRHRLVTVHSRTKTEDQTRAEIADVRRLYVDQGLPLTHVAQQLGHGREWVRARLAAAGIPERERPDQIVVTAQQLRSWHHVQHQTVAQMAVRLGCTAETVRAHLHRHGISLIAGRGGGRVASPRPTRSELTALYLKRRLTVGEVGAHYGRSYAWARDVLIDAGIARRQPGRRDDRPALPPVDPDQLRRWYVEQQWTIMQIADELGCSEFRIYTAMRRHGIPSRPGGSRHKQAPVVDAQRLRELYLGERLSDADIARALGLNTFQVTTRRRELGITRSNPTKPPPPQPSAADLRRLYTEQGLTLEQLAHRYATSRTVVRDWLKTAGVPVRPRTTRATRQTFDTDELRGLYLEREWSGADIAAHYDCSAHVVYRALHYAGIPVRHRTRQGGAAAADRMLDLLYADRTLTQALRRHRVPRQAEPGAINERFPSPVPLTTPLLEELYTNVGLSTRLIELLTGQPADNVLQALHDAHIHVRHRGGPSPWTRRQLGLAPASAETP
jgi:DNA-binding CsgD family transcriptional regulator